MKTQQVLYNWGNVFEMAFFGQYCKEACLEPKQESMVELFHKNSWALLAVNFFCKKAPP